MHSRDVGAHLYGYLHLLEILGRRGGQLVPNGQISEDPRGSTGEGGGPIPQENRLSPLRITRRNSAVHHNPVDRCNSFHFVFLFGRFAEEALQVEVSKVPQPCFERGLASIADSNILDESRNVLIRAGSICSGNIREVQRTTKRFLQPTGELS